MTYKEWRIMRNKEAALRFALDPSLISTIRGELEEENDPIVKVWARVMLRDEVLMAQHTYGLEIEGESD